MLRRISTWVDRGHRVSDFDYYGKLRDLESALDTAGLGPWAERVREAVASGATGTEILMAVRAILRELSAQATLPATIRQSVSVILKETSRALQ
jgi:hypothetical protein